MAEIKYIFLDDVESRLTPQEIEAKFTKAGRYLEIIHMEKRFVIEDYLVNDAEIMRPIIELLNWKAKAIQQSMQTNIYKEYLCIILDASIFRPILNAGRIPSMNFLNKIIKNYDMDMPHVMITGTVPKEGNIKVADYVKMLTNKEVYKCYSNIDELVNAMDYKPEYNHTGKTTIINELSFKKLTCLR